MKTKSLRNDVRRRHLNNKAKRLLKGRYCWHYYYYYYYVVYILLVILSVAAYYDPLVSSLCAFGFTITSTTTSSRSSTTVATSSRVSANTLKFVGLRNQRRRRRSPWLCQIEIHRHQNPLFLLQQDEDEKDGLAFDRLKNTTKSITTNVVDLQDSEAAENLPEQQQQKEFISVGSEDDDDDTSYYDNDNDDNSINNKDNHDSPDRALSIIAELKSNAALFAAFAYGGLSIPSTLTITESKVTSVTSSLSTTRPFPGSDLIQSFVILDTITLCLMISCVAASQLLIYQLTDGSWYEFQFQQQQQKKKQKQRNRDTTDTSSIISSRSYSRSSAMGRLINDYGLEFAIARTTFDMGLIALLLAVGVRTIAIFDETISIPITILLGTTCVLLGLAYIRSYWIVFRRLEEEPPHQEEPQSQSQSQVEQRTATTTSTTNNIFWAAPPIFLIAASASILYFSPYNSIQEGESSSSSSSMAQSTTTTTTTTPSPTVETPNRRGLAARLASYSNAAGEGKIKLAVDKVAEEKAAANTATSNAKTSSKTTRERRGKKKQATTNTKKKDSTTAEATATTPKRKDSTTKVVEEDNVIEKTTKKKEKTLSGETLCSESSSSSSRDDATTALCSSSSTSSPSSSEKGESVDPP